VTDNRKAFEQAYLTAGHDDWHLEKNSQGKYYATETNAAWEGWQLRESTLPREAIEAAIRAMDATAEHGRICSGNGTSALDKHIAALRVLLDQPGSGGKVS
jgi:hypothetical protein